MEGVSSASCLSVPGNPCQHLVLARVSLSERKITVNLWTTFYVICPEDSRCLQNQYCSYNSNVLDFQLPFSFMKNRIHPLSYVFFCCVPSL